MSADARRKVLVVTGSRAEWGLLRWIVEGLAEAEDVELQLVATGMHLAAEFGETVNVIEADGFRLNGRVPTLSSDDSAVGVAGAVAAGVTGFADEIRRLEPDLLLILGDRFEIFAAAQAAMLANVPIAHIAGGDTTEGAIDEAIRHSLTKLSHLHFVTNPESRARVLQMGEDPTRVFDVGSPGVDSIHRTEFLDRKDLERELGIELRSRNALVTFHPETLAPHESAAHLHELLAALDDLGDDFGVWFTMPNADTSGRELTAIISAFVDQHPHAKAFASLGQQRYLSLMKLVDVVIGNSSSALYEAPTLKKPSVNIGERQAGRTRPTSLIDVAPDRQAIVDAIGAALLMDVSSVVNPYGDGGSSERIVATIRTAPPRAALLHKTFRMIGPA